MDYHYAKELLDCLPEHRTLFPYCRDRYAVELLRIASKQYPQIRTLKQSRFAKLLSKPSIAKLLGQCGNGLIEESVLDSYWHNPGSNYLLTTGLWNRRTKGFAQTSRSGVNLVLRLNFNLQHDRLYRNSLKVNEACALNGFSHPVLREGERRYFRETLAWARLDIDLGNDEVLIEEIQSDWARNVLQIKNYLEHYGKDRQVLRFWGFETSVADARHYAEFCEPLLRDWSQAMLAATIHFIVYELGLSQIWYHTWETGNTLKGIDRKWAPPTSLYSKLPRQFCFELTEEFPKLLPYRTVRKRLARYQSKPRFFHLALN